jgi:hypothetical protein
MASKKEGAAVQGRPPKKDTGASNQKRDTSNIVTLSPSKGKLGGGDGGAQDPNYRPVVIVKTDGLYDMTIEVQGHLLDKGLYQRAGKIVRPSLIKVKDQYGNEILLPGIETVNVHQLRLAAVRHIDFVKMVKGELKPAKYNLEAGQALLTLSGDDLKFPILRAITNTPLVFDDGRVLHTPGFDEASGIYFDPSGTRFPAIPDSQPRTMR